MAHSERYGADHPLAKASSIIKRKMRIPIGPLMNFGDANAETSEERTLLEKLWQDAAPLAEAATRAAEAIESEPELQEPDLGIPRAGRAAARAFCDGRLGRRARREGSPDLRPLKAREAPRRTPLAASDLQARLADFKL